MALHLRPGKLLLRRFSLHLQDRLDAGALAGHGDQHVVLWNGDPILVIVIERL
jgi:hypothetical protein